MSCSDVFLGLIAILFPPIAVWIKRGLCSADSLINILLCMLGYVPGLLHAWYIIAKFPEHEYDYEVLDPEGGRSQRVTYYYVSHEGGRQAGRQGRPQNSQTYGTTSAVPKVPGNKPQSQSQAPAPAPRTNNDHAAGSSSTPAGPAVGAGSDEAGAPPSYSEVVKGDNKIQHQT